MRIRELTIENFRRFRQPITLSGFGDDLNLVSEPNESGKSTVLEALRAVLFERHGSRSDRIRSFRPFGDEVAPTISLTFEVSGERWILKKRFLMGPSVTLEGPGGRFQSDAAEEKLQSLLGFVRAGNRGADDDTRGALGLLWVEQGAWNLAAPGEPARKTLEDVLAGQIGAVTGGRRTTAVVQAVDKALADFFTATGRPTRRLQRAVEALDEAKKCLADAEAELAAYDGVLSRLETRRNELRRLMRDIDDPEADTQGAELDQDIARARAAALDLRAAQMVAQQATSERERREEQQTTRRELRDDLATAEAEVQSLQAERTAHEATVESARLAEAEAAAALRDLRKTLRAAESERDASLAARMAEERHSVTRAAFARLDRAAPLMASAAQLQERVDANLFTQKALEGVEALERTVEQAHAAAEAGAPVLRVELSSGSSDARLNGDPLTGSATLSVTKAVTVDLPGVAMVRVDPPLSGEAALARLRAAEAELESALQKLGVVSVGEARQEARTRAEGERGLAAARMQIEAICVADAALKIGVGFAALKTALADTARPPEVACETRVAEEDRLSERAFQDLRAAEQRALTIQEAALAELRKVEPKQIKLASDAAHAVREVTRLTQEIALEIEALSDEALDTSMTTAQDCEARATVDLAAAARAAAILDEAELLRKKGEWTRRTKKLHDDRIELVQEIAGLEVEAKSKGGAGPGARAQEAAEELEYAESEANRLREEGETLRLLKTAISEAQQDAARRYLAPIKNRVQPYVARLLPGTDLAFGEDFRPRSVIRAGKEEPADDLSKGTQEQLAVLTRLAFADLLLENGKPASVVLDDALVFADDDRFDTMTEILSEAAQRMQVIILSCRTSAYRGLDAKRIKLA